MNFKRFHESKNLFDGMLYEGFYNDTGQLVIDSSGAYHSNLIRADEATYTINGLWTGNPALAVYEWDENKQWLRRTNRQTPIGNPITFTLSDTCVYFSLQINSNYNYSNIMLNVGSQPLPYEPYGNTWHDTPHYIHNTSTDTLTTLPAVLYPNDTTATVGLKGDIEQTGTPSPQTPIQPSECGDLSENLYDASDPNIFNGYYNVTTNTLLTTENNAFIYIPLVQGKKYYVYGCKRYNASTLIRWATTSSAPFYNIPCIRTGQFAQTDIFTITAEANENYLAIFLCGDSDYSAYGTVEDAIATNGANLVIDNGYKIPILSNSTTTNVYLGEVQTTRKIKKLVLTGNESWSTTGSSGHSWITTKKEFLPPASSGVKGLIISSHYVTITFNQAYAGNTTGISETATENKICICDTSISSTSDFKTYLQQQYAAGTPVVVWYVLATETTGIVNEPIRKIGDYADKVSGITIPTIAGANTISVGTTLQPSEVTVNYKGWHPVQSVHEMHTHLDASLFELGTITGYGQKDELTTRIRTKTFIDLSNTKSINTLSSAKVFLIAWTEEATTIGYYYCVGGWNGSSFGNQTGLWLSEIDVESIVETYPTYKFAVILRYDDNREVTDFDDLLSLVDFYPRTW